MNSYSVHRLYNHGIPQFTFTKYCKDSTTTAQNYTTDPITDFQERPAVEPTEFTACDEEEQSLFLTALKRAKYSLAYCSEADVVTFVKNILEDVLCFAQLNDNFLILQNASVKLGLDSTPSFGDVWIVENRRGLPILVLEVKKPKAKIIEKKKKCSRPAI
jgi:hypothetical protein